MKCKFLNQGPMGPTHSELHISKQSLEEALCLWIVSEEHEGYATVWLDREQQEKLRSLLPAKPEQSTPPPKWECSE